MRKVTMESELERMRMAMLKLFRATDPFDQPFRNEIKDRLLLVTGNYQLYKDQFAALAYTARQSGEEECGVSTVENHPVGMMERAEHWIGKLDDYQAYRRIPVIMEYALYSLQGEWGLIFSEEFHAVIGGSPNFMVAFKEAYPDWPQEREKFLEHWVENRVKYGSKFKWLPGLLTHIYGEVGEIPLLLRPQE